MSMIFDYLHLFLSAFILEDQRIVIFFWYFQHQNLRILLVEFIFHLFLIYLIFLVQLFFINTLCRLVL